MESVFFVKVTRRYNNRDFIVGIELFEHDTYSTLLADVTMVLETAITVFKTEYPGQSDKFYAESLRGVVDRIYPERKFFLEIGDDNDNWVQVYTPENQRDYN
jgi:hypothetical protein